MHSILQDWGIFLFVLKNVKIALSFLCYNDAYLVITSWWLHRRRRVITERLHCLPRQVRAPVCRAVPGVRQQRAGGTAGATAHQGGVLPPLHAAPAPARDAVQTGECTRSQQPTPALLGPHLVTRQVCHSPAHRQSVDLEDIVCRWLWRTRYNYVR